MTLIYIFLFFTSVMFLKLKTNQTLEVIKMNKKLIMILFGFFILTGSASAATTWYVRTDGGNANQCDGQHDAPLAGATGNQCAFNDPMLVTGWLNGDSPRWSGGDTLIIGDPQGTPGKFPIGYRDINGNNKNGCAAQYGPDCRINNIPSGIDATHPTKILGRQYNTGCSTKTELFGVGGVYWMISMQNVNNIEFQCLTITDHEDCATTFPVNSCQTYSAAHDNARDGVVAFGTTNVYFKNVDVIDLGHDGFNVGHVGNWTLEDVNISGNGWSGWDNAYPGHTTQTDADSNQGPVTFTRTNIEWNGCVRGYPDNSVIEHCVSQSGGGYGDGVGTSWQDGNAGASFTYIDSKVRWNTSDGIDHLYSDGHNGLVKIVRSRIEGNIGNQVKTNMSLQIENSQIIGNCDWLGNQPYAYQPFDFCRAGGDVIVWEQAYSANQRGNFLHVFNSTITGKGNSLEYLKGDFCDGSESIINKNNIMYGTTAFFDASSNTPLYGTELSCSGTYGSLFAAGLDYNDIYNVGNGPGCPFGHNLCVDPKLVSAVYPFDFNLQTGSPVVTQALATITLLNGGNDYNHFDRGSSWDMGSLQFGSSSTQSPTNSTPTPAPSGSPVVSLLADVTSGQAPLTVNFDGSASSSPLGALTNYVWDFGDGVTASGNSKISHVFNQPGQYKVTLTIVDLNNVSVNSSIMINALSANKAPTVNAGVDQTITLPNAAALNGSVSDDGLPNNTLTTSWSKVSGPGTVTFSNPTLANTNATFSAAGTYTLRLTANDSALSASDDVIITVNDAPASAPAAAPTTTLNCNDVPTGSFNACYYDNMDLTNLKVVRNEPAIAFNWGSGSPDPSIGVDTFSARWQGNFTFEAATYTFTATADDGIRVFVDGNLLIDGWKDQAETTYTADLALTAGTHLVKVEYYENTYGAVAYMNWVKKSQPQTQPPVQTPPTQTPPASDPTVTPPVSQPPAPALSCDTVGEGSFIGCYYDNMDLTNLKIVRNDPVIAFNWGNGSPDPSIDVDTFSVRWQGNFTFEAAAYTFTTTADDGIRIYVDGNLLINQWKDQAPTTYKADINLTAGTHLVKVEYYEKSFGAVANVSWKKSTTTQTTTPPPVSTPATKYQFEAENAVSLTAPFQIADDALASGGKFIFVPNGNGNATKPGKVMATYTVNLTQDGQYILFGRVIAPTTVDDSFYVQIDNGADITWDLTNGTAWHWDKVRDRGTSGPVKLNLKAGLHTIKIKWREDGAKLDTLLLTSDLNYVP